MTPWLARYYHVGISDVGDYTPGELLAFAEDIQERKPFF